MNLEGISQPFYSINFNFNVRLLNFDDQSEKLIIKIIV